MTPLKRHWNNLTFLSRRSSRIFSASSSTNLHWPRFDVNYTTREVEILYFIFRVEWENQATEPNTFPEYDTSDASDFQLPRDDVTRVGVTRVYADERVGEYAVPRVSHYVGRDNTVDDTNVRREFGPSEERISQREEFEENAEDLNAEAEIFERKDEDFNSTDFTDEMNGNAAIEDSTDGVKELAASFQHQIHEETAKATKGKPPPVKPKVYKKPPPPVVAPKPKANGIKINVIHSPTGI
jgi:hypothetical protein